MQSDFNNIKRFIDKVASMESRNQKDFIISSSDAKSLRDEIAKLLASCIKSEDGSKNNILNTRINGGRF